VISHCGGGKFNNQLKRAFNCGAKIAVILKRENNGVDPLKFAKIRTLGDSAAADVLEIGAIPDKVTEILRNSAS
jgi:histidyl-tRNA synthetase